MGQSWFTQQGIDATPDAPRPTAGPAPSRSWFADQGIDATPEPTTLGVDAAPVPWPSASRADSGDVSTAGVDEAAFRQWYAGKARDYNLSPSPDGQFYDYRAAFRAGASPGPDGHWPSQFKQPGHPNEVVGGFNTRTGQRVPGTPRASEQDLVASGWEPETAKRLAATPDTPPAFNYRGNIDLVKQPRVKNDDGTTSTVRSMSVEIEGREILIPTVAHDGSRILSDDEAVEQYRRSGKHLGIFKTPDEATRYAEQLHEDYEAGKYDAPPASSALSTIGDYLRLGAENTLAALPTSPPVQATREAVAGLFELNKGVWGGLKAAADVLGIPSLGEWADSARSDATAMQNATAGPQEGRTTMERAVYGGFRSIGGSAASLAAGLASGNPVVPFVTMTGQTAGTAYGDARDKKVRPLEAALYATTHGLIEGYTERIPASRLLTDLARGSSLMATVMRQVVSEVPGEQVATAAQDLNDWATLPENAEKPLSAWLAERPSAAGQTLVSTLVATIGQTAAAHGAMKLLEPKPSSADVVRDGVGGDAAGRVTTDAAEAATAPPAASGAPPAVRPGEDSSTGTMGDLLTPPAPKLTGNERAAQILSDNPDIRVEDFQAALGIRAFGAARSLWQSLRADTLLRENPAVTAEELQEALGLASLDTAVDVLRAKRATMAPRTANATSEPLLPGIAPETGPVDAVLHAGITDAQRAQLVSLGYDPDAMTIVDAQEVLRGGLPPGRAPRAIPAAGDAPMTPQGRAAIAIDHANNPAQQRAAEAMQHATRQEAPPRGQPEMFGAAPTSTESEQTDAPTGPDETEAVGESGRPAWRRVADRVADRRATPDKRAAVAAEHDADLRAAVLDAAQAVDPSVDPDELHAELDFRLDLYHSQQNDTKDAGLDPRELLTAIAERGGLSEKDDGKGQRGELDRLRDGTHQKDGAFGRFGGVPGVFRARTYGGNGAPQTGLPLDVMLQSLQADPRFSWIEDINQLVDILDDVNIHGTDVNDVLPGTDTLTRSLGVDLGTAWWKDSWSAPSDADTSFDFADDAPAAEDAPADAARSALKADAQALLNATNSAATLFADTDALLAADDEIAAIMDAIDAGAPLDDLRTRLDAVRRTAYGGDPVVPAAETPARTPGDAPVSTVTRTGDTLTAKAGDVTFTMQAPTTAKSKAPKKPYTEADRAADVEAIMRGHKDSALADIVTARTSLPHARVAAQAEIDRRAAEDKTPEQIAAYATGDYGKKTAKAKTPGAPPASKWTAVGTNRDGQTLYEDDKGVRSMLRDGMRVSEKVGIIPGGGITTDRTAQNRDYLTADELEALAPTIDSAPPVADEAPVSIDPAPAPAVAEETDEELADRIYAQLEAEAAAAAKPAAGSAPTSATPPSAPALHAAQRVPDEWFHGTLADYDEPRPSRDGEAGPGVYLTSNPAVAGRRYALREDMDEFNEGEDPVGANVRPVKLRDGAVLLDARNRQATLADAQALIDALAANGTPVDFTAEDALSGKAFDVNSRGDFHKWDLFEWFQSRAGRRVLNVALAKAGYSGVLHMSDHNVVGGSGSGSDTVAVFDPKDIVSAIAAKAAARAAGSAPASTAVTPPAAAPASDDAPSTAWQTHALGEWRHTDRDSVEIKFPGKPSADILAEVKRLGFRWAKGNKVWYSKKPGAAAAAKGVLGAAAATTARKPGDAPVSSQRAPVDLTVTSLQDGTTETVTVGPSERFAVGDRAIIAPGDGWGKVIEVSRDGEKIRVEIEDGRASHWINVSRATKASADAAPATGSGFKRGEVANETAANVAAESAMVEKGRLAHKDGHPRVKGNGIDADLRYAWFKGWDTAEQANPTKKKPVTPQVGWGSAPKSTPPAPAPAPPANPKKAALDEKKSALQAEIDAAAAELKAALRAAGLTANSGLPLPPKPVVLATVKLVRLYAKLGIVDAEAGWLQFQETMGEVAQVAKRAFTVAWANVHGVAEPTLTDEGAGDVDAAANRGRDDRRPAESDGSTANAVRGERESALGGTSAATDGGTDGGRDAGRDNSGEGTRSGVRDAAGDGADRPASASGGRAKPAGSVPATRNDHVDTGYTASDYTLTPERIQAIVDRGPMQRAKDNLAAMLAVKTIQAEKRQATAEEQDALAKYVGWGDSQVARFLDEHDYGLRSAGEKALWNHLRSETTPEERKALRRSTLNAHFTFGLYSPLWEALENAGFTHGKVLEPAVGSGHAFALMPPQARMLSTLHGVEKEGLTAKIAAALFPSARIQAAGFEQARLAKGTFDLAISNVPFGDYEVVDRLMPDFITKRIHNYFFAKALEYVRPGGLVVFITSKGTMDAKGGTRMRRYLTERAHFLGAVRLPDTAFKEGASTEVVTDVIVLQRKTDDTKPGRNAASFIDTVQTKEVGVRSKWYEEHPELIIGDEGNTGKMYRGGSYNVSGKGVDVPALLRDALTAVLPARTYTPNLVKPAQAEDATDAAETAKVKEYQIVDGKVVQVSSDRALVPVPLTGAPLKRLKGLIGLRDQLRTVRSTMQNVEAGDAAVKKEQKALRKLYNAFTSEHGLLNERANLAAFALDPEAPNVATLEVVEVVLTPATVKGKTKLKAGLKLVRLSDIFEKRLIGGKRQALAVDTPKDALLASLGVQTSVDWDYMSSVSGRDVAALQQSLIADGLVFEQPDGSWVTADEYLSGDVVSKLADAEAAGKGYERNIESLKAVQPTPRAPGDVPIALGSTWVNPRIFADFIEDLLGVTLEQAPKLAGTSQLNRWVMPKWGPEIETVAKRHSLSIEYGPSLDDHIDPARLAAFKAEHPFGVGNFFTVLDLFEALMNLQQPTLRYKVGSGKDAKDVTNSDATVAARTALDLMQSEWDAYLISKPDTLRELTDIYNEKFNRNVRRQFDGSHLAQHLRDRGMALPFDLHPHQLRGIWRALVSGNTLLAHEVGAGKTYEGVAIAMEWRRTGRARKPMITVPTYLLASWKQSVMEMYPGAKILAFESDDLAANKRQAAMARIANGDWDIVLVPHSSFELLKASQSAMNQVLSRLLDEARDAVQEATQAEGKNSAAVKATERILARIEAQIAKQLQKTVKGDDNNLTWDDLGVDGLIVDEAHAFKNLYYFSQMDNVRGLSRSYSDRSLGMYVKLQKINEDSGHRNMVFMTATPVMNSMVEVFTMQRYLQPQTLETHGLASFDSWYRMFGKAGVVTEPLPDGTYREVLRVGEFRNLDQLSTTFQQVMDYVGWKDMPYLKLPKVRFEIVETPKHPAYNSTLMPWFAKRLAIIKQYPARIDQRAHPPTYKAPARPHPITGRPTDKPDLVLTVMNDARAASIDARLVLPGASDFEGSRMQAAADKIAFGYKAEQEKLGVQLVFLDTGTPKGAQGSPAFLRGAAVDAEGNTDEDESVDAAEAVDDSVAVLEADMQVDLYALLRADLVKRGIPDHEIAYVHEAKTGAERMALFAAANEGKVRVVFASTDKGGVGMNIQRRLFAEHEIDVPRAMRPGDQRQRLGRMVRQGNLYEHVTDHRYITKGTTDEWLYGLMAAKQDVTESFMQGTAISFIEPDASMQSVEEAQARSAGDMRGAEKVRLKAELQRLEVAAKGAEKALIQAKLDVPMLERKIATLNTQLDTASAFDHQELTGKNFTADLGGETRTDRSEANSVLLALLRTVGERNPEVDLGTFGGLALRGLYKAPYRWAGAEEKGHVYLQMDARPAGAADWVDVAVGDLKQTEGVTSEEEKKRLRSFNIPVTKLFEDRNLVQSMQNKYVALAEIPGQVMQERANLTKRLERDRATVATPNPAIEKLRVSKARYEELDKELNKDSEARNKALVASAKEYVAHGGILEKPLKPNAAQKKLAAAKDAGATSGNAAIDTVDTLDTGEQQPRLAGDVGAVRDEERAQPTEDVPEQTLQLRGEQAEPEQARMFGAAPKSTKPAKAAKPSGMATMFEDDGDDDSAADTGPTAAPTTTLARPTVNPYPLAGAGQPAPLPATVRQQSAATAARPLAFPELVAFATELIGHAPSVVRAFREMETRAVFKGGSIVLRADMFTRGNEATVAAALAHEVGHLEDWLPDHTMKRGNLLGRLRSLSSFLRGTYTAQDGKTIKNAVVRKELVALSAAWRPWPEGAEADAGYAKYRNSSRELYADAISVLLNDPAMLKATAPTFYKEYFAELDAKPEVKAAYFDLLELLSGTPEQLIARRQQRVTDMFEKGDAKAIDVERERQAEREASRGSLAARLRIELVDKDVPVLDRVAALEARGVRLNPDDDPRYALKELRHLGALQHGFLARAFEPIHARVMAAGIGWSSFGKVLFYERIVTGDRSDMANPLGLGVDAARDLLADLMQSLTPAQRNTVTTAVAAFRAAVREVTEDAYDAGLYKPEVYEKMQENPAWAAFRVIDYMHEDMSASVKHQIGTLKDIQNPADATILKTLVTLRAIELQRAKLKTFDAVARHDPSEIEQAKQVWGGNGLVLVDPKDDTLRLVRYYEKGALRGKYVPADVADALENASIGQNLAVLEGLRFANSKWFRPVFTSMNLGFQGANFFRDLWRYWSNMPGSSLASTLRAYVKAAPIAKMRAFGLVDEDSWAGRKAYRSMRGLPASTPTARERSVAADLAEATEARILGMTFNDIAKGRQVEDSQIEELFTQHGLTGAAPTPARAGLKQIQQVLDLIERTGNFIESLPKVAAVHELRGQRTISSLTADERAFIREKVGSPDFLIGGTLKPITNELFLFSNAIVQAIRADIDVATGPKTRAAFWRKNVTAFMVPVMLGFAVEHFGHLLDSDDDDDENPTGWRYVQRILRGVSEYDKSNYTIIPLSLDEDGKSVYLRIPRSDAGRLLGAILRKALNAASGEREVAESAAAILGYIAGQVPGVTPMVGVIDDGASFASGENVYDSFRSREVFTRDEMDAGIEARAQKFVGYEFQKIGLGIVGRFIAGDARPREMTTGQKVLEYTPVVGRFMRISDFGHAERLRAAQNTVRKAEANARMDEKAAVNDALRTYLSSDQMARTPGRQAELARGVVAKLYADAPRAEQREQFRDVLKKIRMGAVRGKADPVVNAVMGATSTAQRVAIIREAFPDPVARRQWVARALKERVISAAVATASQPGAAPTPRFQ